MCMMFEIGVVEFVVGCCIEEYLVEMEVLFVDMYVVYEWIDVEGFVVVDFVFYDVIIWVVENCILVVLMCLLIIML